MAAARANRGGRGLSALDRLAARTRAGTIGEHLSVTEVIPHDGPARVILGSYGTATSAIKAPSPMNYLAVRLKAGERWSYRPPRGHTSPLDRRGMGSVLVPDEFAAGRTGGLQAFEHRDRIRGQSDAEGGSWLGCAA